MAGKPNKGTQRGKPTEVLNAVGVIEVEKRMGRPSEFNRDITDILCQYLATGMSLVRACNQPDMPDPKTVYRWMREHEDFRQEYTHAKQEAADAMAEDILDIADDGTNDWMEDQYMRGNSPGWKVNGEAVQRSKLRVDARMWLMGKMKPKKYGDKLDLTTGGNELPTPILGTMVVRDKPETVSEEGEIISVDKLIDA